MTAKNKGITRIEYEGVSTRGWMVRITREGKRKQQFFGDRSHGGKNKALAAAKACYAEWLTQAAPIRTTRNVKTSRNSSGKVGVHEVRNVDSRWENAESFGYCASWVTKEGQRQKLSFAWNRYGKQAAWKLACLARQKELTNRAKVVALYEKQTGKKVKFRK
ncbi:MAG: transcriptional regulator [Pirellula sp.]